MPRNGAGTYSLPGTYEAVSGETILAAQHNDPLEDLEQDANAARPVGAGGTGGQTAIAGNDGLNTTANNMASASTVDLSAATGVVVNITGTTTITALGTVSSGALRVLIFAGALTLTHNPTSLILPTGANITTAAGDVATMRSKGGGNWKCVGYQRADGTALALPSSPAISGATTITSTAAGDLLTLESQDAGAGNGPNVVLYRNSASPAASDVLGVLYWKGKDSAGNLQAYGDMYGLIVDPVSGTEDFSINWETTIAGANGLRMSLGAGLSIAATGGDKGAGTLNATGLYVNGTQIPFSAAYESSQQTITSGGSLTLAHGLGVRPKHYDAFLQCTTAELGYSIGDEVKVNPSTTYAAADLKGLSIVPDATNINIRFAGGAANAMALIHKTTGTPTTITNTSWRLVIRAWA